MRFFFCFFYLFRAASLDKVDDKVLCPCPSECVFLFLHLFLAMRVCVCIACVPVVLGLKGSASSAFPMQAFLTVQSENCCRSASEREVHKDNEHLHTGAGAQVKGDKSYAR